MFCSTRCQLYDSPTCHGSDRHRVAKVHTDAAAGAGAAPSTHPRSRSCCNPRRALHHYVENWGVYLKQTVLLPNLALALLYCTVLSLGFLMTSYMSWSGLTEAEVGTASGTWV